MKSLLRFSVRDLLFLTLLVAMGLGWYLDRAELSRERAHATEWMARTRALASILKSEGFSVDWDPKRISVTVKSIDPSIITTYYQTVKPTTCDGPLIDFPLDDTEECRKQFQRVVTGIPPVTVSRT